MGKHSMTLKYYHTLHFTLADHYSALSINTDGNIGNGAFGVVFKATYKGSPCAAKMLTLHSLEMITGLKTTQKVQTAALESFQKECEYLKSLEDKNIVRHIATVTEPKANLPILMMELMDCSLKQHLSEMEIPISSCQALSLCSDIIHGLAFLHSQNIIHRDLCDDNVLLKVTLGTPTAKISDFGMSRILPDKSMSRTLTGLGHRQVYLPPEAMDDPYHYSHSMDVYSFGVLATQILRVKVNIRNKKELLAIFDSIPETHALKNIVRASLSEDKKNRPQAAAVAMQIQTIRV